MITLRSGNSASVATTQTCDERLRDSTTAMQPSTPPAVSSVRRRSTSDRQASPRNTATSRPPKTLCRRLGAASSSPASVRKAEQQLPRDDVRILLNESVGDDRERVEPLRRQCGDQREQQGCQCRDTGPCQAGAWWSGKQADDDAGHHHRCQEVEAVAKHLGAGQVGVGVGQATEERRAEDDGVADVHNRVAGQHRCEESPRPPPRQRHDDQTERRDVEGLDEALLHASKGDPLSGRVARKTSKASSGSRRESRAGRAGGAAGDRGLS